MFLFFYFFQLRDTKSISHNTTLLHFLAEKCEENHPEILRFPEELEHVDSASKGMVLCLYEPSGLPRGTAYLCGVGKHIYCAKIEQLQI